MSQSKISIKRHIAKTISYRILGSLITILTALSLGLPVKFAGILGIGELLFKPFIYFLHERMWYKWIKFGVIEDKSEKIF
jgi:uncharacterized membrane protein